MSRRERREAARRARRAATAPAEDRRARPARPKRRATVAAAVVLVAVVAWLALRPGTADFPALRPAESPKVRFDDFLGAAACRGCHPAEYAAWARSTHALAGGAPDSVRLIAPFDGQPFGFRDAVVTPRRGDGGTLRFDVVQADGATHALEVHALIGGGHLAGGGTQGFLTALDDGTLRFLPFDYSAVEETWFCNTTGRAGRGWLPITPELALADCADWPPVRLLGDHPQLANCQQCHGSQIQLVPGHGARFTTRYTSLAVNCESCHGPGRPHVAAVREGRHLTNAEIGMASLETLSEDASLDVCFRCHALKTALAPGYLPGDPFEEFYSVMLPVLINAPFFPDGRVRTFAYQQNHRASDCYVSGRMTCTDCHDPHRQTYRDATGRPLAGRFDDGQCLACHPSKAERPEEHTHHPPGTPGARCVACHMPYLQAPLVGTAIRYARSDHTISIPRPGLDAALRLHGACAQCHPDRSPDALAAQVRAWDGEIKPLPARVTALLEARSQRERLRAARAVVSADPRPQPLARFAGLSHLFIQHLFPDMPELEPEVLDALRTLAGDPDDDVAAVALASLHMARGGERETHEFLRARLGALGARERAVRRRWATILEIRARSAAISGEPVAARVIYGRLLELVPDHAEAQAALGGAEP